MATNCEADSFMLSVRDSSPPVRQSLYLLPLAAQASHSTEQTTADVLPHPQLFLRLRKSVISDGLSVKRRQTSYPPPATAPGTPLP